MSIDLDNIQNMFLIADCHNNDQPDLQLVKKYNYNSIIKGILYKYKSNLIITFGCYDYCGDVFSFASTGFQLWYYQNMKKIGCLGINTFFHNYSKLIYNEFESYINDHIKAFPKGHIYITGISMGGALSQCFYYHFKQTTQSSYRVSISTFGSPRIGDANLRKWFMNNTKSGLTINNYVLFKLIDGYKKADPVVLFPHCSTSNCYVNNAKLTMIFNKQIEKSVNASNIIDQPDTDITLKSLICGSHYSKYWDEIHDLEQYYNNL